jgi:hypothetical protein
MNLAPNDLHTGFQRHLRCAHVLVGSDKGKLCMFISTEKL